MAEALLPKSVAIIGSFKQNYQEVLADWQTFNQAGLEITSPKGDPIVTPDIDFIRFEGDDPGLTDAQVQQIALHRILRADFVYTVALGGYVGRSTCYEIGQVKNIRPIYFSEQPSDLPVEVPADHIARASELVERFKAEMPRPLLESLAGYSHELEINLAAGNYLNL